MILLANGEGAAGIATTARLLASGAGALDAIEAGIRLVEADPNVRSVGPGSWPNILGELQLDAVIPSAKRVIERELRVDRHHGIRPAGTEPGAAPDFRLRGCSAVGCERI